MVLKLVDFLDGESELFGSLQGGLVFNKLLQYVQDKPSPIKICITGIEVIDSTFVRESIGSLAKMLVGKKHFVILNPDSNISSNWVMGLRAKEVTLVAVNNCVVDYIGAPISESNKKLLELVRIRGEVGTSELARSLGQNVQNVSTRLKRLVAEGLLVRTAHASATGGTEFRYNSII